MYNEMICQVSVRFFFFFFPGLCCLVLQISSAKKKMSWIAACFGKMQSNLCGI